MKNKKKNVMQEENIPGIYNIPESDAYRMSRADRMKKLTYISICVKAKPNLEDFVNLNSFDSKAKAGEFGEKEDLSYYFNSKLDLLLQSYNCPKLNKESFLVFGKPKSVLRYLKKNCPEEHLRLKNYLEYGLDTEFVKKTLSDSQAYMGSFELLSGMKLTSDEKKK